MYYTVIKHDRHLRTRGKCGKHEPQASVFYISRVFSNDWTDQSEHAQGPIYVITEITSVVDYIRCNLIIYRL